MALPLFVMVSLLAENQQIVLALRGGGDLVAVVSGEAGDIVHGAGIVHQDLDPAGFSLAAFWTMITGMGQSCPRASIIP